MKDLTYYRFNDSVLSFEKRGVWGNKDYPGNVSGYVVLGFLAHFHKKPEGLFVDPMQGSGTSRDCAGEAQIPYQGFDLKEGFNILTDRLISKLEKPAHTIFIHPPYKDMIAYGGEEGKDLSTFKDMWEWLEMCQLALMNVYEALEDGGHYGVLMGNQRAKGVFYPLASRLFQYAPGNQVMELVKVQHNTRSGRNSYFGNANFIPTMHELLGVFQKPEVFKFTLDIVVAKDMAIDKFYQATWRNAVRMAMMENGGTITLQQLYKMFDGSSKTLANPNWQAKIRQVVQQPEFKRISEGTYQLGMAIQ